MKKRPVGVEMNGITALPKSYYPDKKLIELMTFIGNSIDFDKKKGQGVFESDCFGKVYFINDRKQMQMGSEMN